MEIRTVLKKGTDHLVNCEDDLFFLEYFSPSISDKYYIGAVFDGCSTGIKSHFASSLYSKILKQTLNSARIKSILDEGETSLSDIAVTIFQKFFSKLKEIQESLNLIDLEIVSTFIITIVKGDEYFAIVSGDGCILVDEQEIKIESEENAPDYLGYHLNKWSHVVYSDNIKKFSGTFETGLSICSDGIYSFRFDNKFPVEETPTNPFEYLLKDVNLVSSDAMLARKYNILLKKGYSNYDDLSIVRFIK